MATQIPIGSALAKKLFSVALFSSMQHEPGFTKLLTGAAPTQGAFEAKMKGQTSPDYPIVKVTDLSKGQGDVVSIDLFNILIGKPVMGDQRLAGKMMSLTNSSMDVRVDQTRGGADGGGRMTQQRTVYNLRGVAQATLTNWGARLRDQLALVQLAGARGSQNTADWVIPLTSDSDFTSIVVNAIKVPTKNRQFYANDATAPNDVGTNDNLTLRDIDRVASVLAESNIPLQPIKFEGDPYSWNEPTYVMFVSERVWLYLQACANQSIWRTFLQNAYERRSSGMRHPLFYGDVGFWRGILVKPLKRYAVRFNAADVVTYDSGGADGLTYTETTTNGTVGANITIDRSIILGAQALAMVYGKHQSSDYFMDWNEELVDHKNAVEISVAMMGGCAKTRFRVRNGNDNTYVDSDHGVACIDSYAPDPQSSFGRTLLAAG
jgi:N4-gp56 family major capsid protein